MGGREGTGETWPAGRRPSSGQTWSSCRAGSGGDTAGTSSGPGLLARLALMMSEERPACQILGMRSCGALVCLARWSFWFDKI